MSLFAELKRRNVFRVGIAYVVVAWLVLQVADVILNNVAAPGWVFYVTLMLLGIGLVIVLVFAWVFELTPEGLKRESEVDRSQSITQHTGRKLDRLITGVLVLALGYFVIDKFVLSAHRESVAVQEALEQAAQQEAPVSESEAGNEKSIAVLPFVNMSDDAANEYFSDGVSEEILNALARVRELKVAGRTSSFAFKGQNQDLRTIGETLGVNNILEGSVRKAGDRVRITAQLVKVDDGFHLWSETFDRRLDDVFAIQDEIATAILQAMKATLLDEQEAPVVASTRTETEVYDLYLLAKQRMYERTELTLQAAADLLDKAIALDPAYAPAYAQRGIAALLLSESSYGDTPNDQANAQARLYLDKALELDANLAEAWAGLGLYYNGPPPQPAKSVEVLEKAIEINPNLNDAGNWLVLAYWSVNRANESMALLDRIAERDPLYKPAFGNRVFQMTQMGRAEEARGFVDSIEPFMPDDAQIRQTRAWIDYTEGKTAAGLRRMQSALEKHPNDRVFRVGVNQGHYMTHQFERVIDDNWSPFPIFSLLQLGRIEEATIVAQKRAANGVVAPLFTLLVATNQSDALIQYLEEHWPDLDAFQRDVPAPMWGYGQMASIAWAYRQAGQQEGFDDAMARLRESNDNSLAQGLQGNFLKVMVAAHHAMSGDTELALEFLGQAIDAGFVAPPRISSLLPYFRELDGDPRYEAIQARMIQNVNRERKLLGLEPVST